MHTASMWRLPGSEPASESCLEPSAEEMALHGCPLRTQQPWLHPRSGLTCCCLLLFVIIYYKLMVGRWVEPHTHKHGARPQVADVDVAFVRVHVAGLAAALAGEAAAWLAALRGAMRDADRPLIQVALSRVSSCS